jgi:hypothetical protein
MKLLFIENRYATWVYEAVAKRLEAQGHEIHWLVQNPVFKPKFGHTHVMPFPYLSAEATSSGDGFDWLARTDRGVLHFGATRSHYPHYDEQARKHLTQIQPDVIFGEATEFHELLVIRHAKALGIPYLSPNVTRYPSDRLAFMAYDSLNPLGGDGSTLSDADADRMLDGIRNRKVVPSYMRPAVSTPWNLPLIKVADKARITWGWLRGERYITPSPLRKVALNAAQRDARAQWEQHAAGRTDAWAALKASTQPWVLYALQMQPEGNIDVWGTPWNDQAAIIQRAAESLARIGAILVVKPNPKSKYEMNAQLNHVVSSTPNVLALPHATAMAEVFPHAPLVMAVTGTVLMECIFSGKSVASLGDHAMTQYPGVTSLADPEALAPALLDAVRGALQTASLEQARTLLQSLHTQSYSAAIWDPVEQPHFATPEVLLALTEAFSHVLAVLASTSSMVPR